MNGFLPRIRQLLARERPRGPARQDHPVGGRYELTRTSDHQFMFNLKASNGEVILTSERYQRKAGVENGIASVETNSPIDERYDRLTSKADQPYFTLKAANGQVIGRSKMYSSTSARDKGIESVKANGPTAEIDDQT